VGCPEVEVAQAEAIVLDEELHPPSYACFVGGP
jgi:hypothetical protein